MVRLPPTPRGGFVPIGETPELLLPPTPQGGFVPIGETPGLLDPSKPITPVPFAPTRGNGFTPSRDIPSPPLPPPSLAPTPPPTITPTGLSQAQIESQRQRDIAIGFAARTPTTPAFKKVGEKDISQRLDQKFKPTITRFPGESKEAFEFRARQVGRGLRIGQPEDVRRFEEAREQARQPQEVQESIEIITPINTKFGSGGSLFGKFLDIGSSIIDKGISKIPDDKRLKLNIPIFVGAGGSFKLIDISIKETLEKKFIPPQTANLLAQTADSLVKFGLFAPALTTPTQVSSKLIKEGTITPVTETIFKAKIKRVDGVSKIDIDSLTRIGGKEGITIPSFSKQVSVNIDDLTTATLGQGTIVTGRTAQTFTVLGKGIRTGKAGSIKLVGSNIDDVSSFFVKDLGKGFQVRTIVQPTFNIRVDPLVAKFEPSKLIFSIGDDPPISFIQNIRIDKVIPGTGQTGGTFSGFIKPTKIENIFKVGGTTDDLTTVLGRTGFRKGFTAKQIDVTGTIKVLKDIPKDKGFTIITGGRTKTSLAKTFAPQITEQEAVSVLSQVTGTQSNVLSKVLGNIKTISPKTSVVTSTGASALKQLNKQIPKDNRFAIPQGRIPSFTETGKIKSLGALDTKLIVSQLGVQGQKILQQQQNVLKSQTKQRQKIVFDTRTKLLQKQFQGQKLALSLGQRSKLKQQQQQRGAFSFNFPKLPKIPKKTPAILPSILKPFKFPKERIQKFEVFGRRFGKFKVIGIAKTERGAFAIGKRFVGTTLAAAFKIPKAKRIKIPGFRTKKEDGGILFIEPRKRRLKKRGREVLEIQQFKLLKGGIKL